MKFHIGDKFVFDSIECKVAFINALGHAYLVPEADEDPSHNILKGLVFAVINEKGLDKQGKKAHAILNKDCGAV